MKITTKGPWKRVDERLPYEMNQSGIMRTASDHAYGAGIYIKPSTTEKSRARYHMQNHNRMLRRAWTIKSMLKRLWNINIDPTDSDIRMIKKLSEDKNQEQGKNQKNEAPKERKIAEEDAPVTVNGKRRHCVFCGYLLYKSDNAFFYHKSCYTSRNVDIVDDCFIGAYSF